MSKEDINNIYEEEAWKTFTHDFLFPLLGVIGTVMVVMIILAII